MEKWGAFFVTKMRIGIIAEDDSDIEVLKHFASKLTSRSFSVDKFVGKGCGSLKRKTAGWCKALIQKGCSSVVLVHDRDRHDEQILRGELERLLVDVNMLTKVVVIPCEELEAWLLSDTKALKIAMKLESLPKVINHPERIESPKEHIGKLVRAHSKNMNKQYVNTVHNLLIAKALSVAVVSARCPSFHHFEEFVTEAIR